MDRKGLAPLILIPIILVGLIAAFFIIKALIGIFVTAFFWTASIAVIIMLIYIIYKVFRMKKK